MLAIVEGEKITQSQFEAELDRRAGGIPSAYASLEQREALLEELIRRKAALVRAREQHLDHDPETAALVEQLISSRYIESELSKATEEAPSVTTAEIEEYYRNNAPHFRQPSQVRCGVIWLKSSAKAEPTKRDEIRLKAEGLRKAAVNADAAAFAQLVQQHSDDQSTRYIAGDTGWLKAEDSSTRLPREVVRAAMQLNQAGEVAPLVESDNGFYVVRLTEREAASLRPLSEVEDAIRYNLQKLKRQQVEQAVFDKMKDGLKIKIYQQAFDTLPPPSSTATAKVPRLPGR